MRQKSQGVAELVIDIFIYIITIIQFVNYILTFTLILNKLLQYSLRNSWSLFLICSSRFI
jgi:hypothetical protein